MCTGIVNMLCSLSCCTECTGRHLMQTFCDCRDWKKCWTMCWAVIATGSDLDRRVIKLCIYILSPWKIWDLQKKLWPHRVLQTTSLLWRYVGVVAVQPVLKSCVM